MHKQFYVFGKDGKEMRKWCVVFTAVAFAVLLGGCGKSASDKNTKKETEKVKETAAQAITEVHRSSA